MQNLKLNTKKTALTLVSILGVSSIALGQNLIQNPSGEDALVGGEIPSWTEVVGTDWGLRENNPFAAHDGDNFIFAGSVASGELIQDVNVSQYSVSIDRGNATFVYSSYVASFNGSDDSQVIIEYRDEANTTVLSSFDSGQLSPGQVWTEVADTRLAPVGTRTIRIRLLANRDAGSVCDGYHDDLSLTTTASLNLVGEIETKLVANDGASFDEFGTSVSIDGNYAIVGATDDDDTASRSGSAYIYIKNGNSWSQQVKINANDPAANDEFGNSVSIDGDYAIIGAFNDDDNGSASGSAYIFKRSGVFWFQEAKLTANEGAIDDEFGISVSISGEYAIVGSHFDDDNGSSSGSAYIFKRTGTSWAQQAKITPNDGANSDVFGQSVSIDGDYAIIGAELDDDDGNKSGSAYIFTRSGSSWSQQAKLTASDADAGDFFGCAVAIDGENAIVGAYGNDDVGNESGSAYTFKRNGTSWSEEAKLVASDAGEGDQFGFSVSISGENAAVGANLTESSNAGSTYLFQRAGTSWSELKISTADDGTTNDELGASIGIDGNNIIAGARINNTSQGAAYIFGFHNFPNLVQNGGCEESLVGGEIPSWTEVAGTDWQRRSSSPSAKEGSRYFFAGTNDNTSELMQDVDVSDYSTAIDAGTATFNWSSYVSSFGGSDEAKIILEYRDAANTTVLSTFDSGFSSPGQTWTLISDSRVAPVGTRTIRVRMQAKKNAGGNSDGYQDELFLYTESSTNGDTPLAVELNSFSATQTENTIQLNWSTASEKENEGFNVYRKTGNSKFTKIASYKGNSELVGALNSSTTNFYTFIDESEFRNGEIYTYYISDVETNGNETAHKEISQNVEFIVEGEQTVTKLEYELAQNFPNPFNPSTQINFQITKKQEVKLQVFNIKGQLVKELVNKNLDKGSHFVKWNGTDSFGKSVSSGTYFYRISAGTFTQTNRMVLLK